MRDSRPYKSCDVRSGPGAAGARGRVCEGSGRSATFPGHPARCCRSRTRAPRCRGCQRCGGGAFVGNEDRKEQRAHARFWIGQRSADSVAELRRQRPQIGDSPVTDAGEVDALEQAVRDAGHRQVDLRQIEPDVADRGALDAGRAHDPAGSLLQRQRARSRRRRRAFGHAERTVQRFVQWSTAHQLTAAEPAPAALRGRCSARAGRRLAAAASCPDKTPTNRRTNPTDGRPFH